MRTTLSNTRSVGERVRRRGEPGADIEHSLTPREGLELMAIFQRGRIAEDLLNASDTPRPDLEHQVVEGRRALEVLVRAHYHLAVGIAKGFCTRGHLQEEDWVQDCLEGLILGLQSFDPSSGCSLPAHCERSIRRWALNCASSSESISCAANDIHSSQLDSILSAVTREPSIAGANDPFAEADLRADIDAAIRELEADEALAIDVLFGLRSGEECPLEHAAVVMHMSPERVLELRSSALKRLAYAPQLQQYRRLRQPRSGDQTVTAETEPGHRLSLCPSKRRHLRVLPGCARPAGIPPDLIPAA